MNVDPIARICNPIARICNPDGMAPFGFDKNKFEELEPIVDINEMLAYEPEPVGMGLKKPTDPPGGYKNGKKKDTRTKEEKDASAQRWMEDTEEV